MVESGGLENRCAREGTGGSNPSPSAKYTNSKKICYIYQGFVMCLFVLKIHTATIKKPELILRYLF